jgi:hypothetical protein
MSHLSAVNLGWETADYRSLAREGEAVGQRLAAATSYNRTQWTTVRAWSQLGLRSAESAETLHDRLA